MRSYGLIGYPLGHSFSRKFFSEKFLRENKPEQYLNFEIPDISLLRSVIRTHPDLVGLNVTIPYKELVVPFLDALDEVSSVIRAVNTIRIIRTSTSISMEGYNTDVFGFTESLNPLLKPHHRKALILGTGGASKAVSYSLKQLGLQYILVSRRTGREHCFSYDDLDSQIMDEYNIIINTTPLGTYPDAGTFPPIPYHYITSRHLIYDLVYNPAETRFLAMGKEHGATVKNGYEMLELQAIRSYEIWNSNDLSQHTRFST